MCAAEFGHHEPMTAFCASRPTRIFTGFILCSSAFPSVRPPACSTCSRRRDSIEALKRMRPTVPDSPGPRMSRRACSSNLFAGVDFSCVAVRGAVRIDGAGDPLGRIRGSDAERQGLAGLGNDRTAIRSLQPAVRCEARFASKPSAAQRPAPSCASPTADDRVLPSPAKSGELHVRGCSLFSGYVDNEEANREADSPPTAGFAPAISRSMDANGNVASARAHQGTDQPRRHQVQSDRHRDRNRQITRPSRRSRSRPCRTRCWASAHRVSSS